MDVEISDQATFTRVSEFSPHPVRVDGLDARSDADAPDFRTIAHGYDGVDQAIFEISLDEADIRTVLKPVNLFFRDLHDDQVADPVR